MQCCCTFSETLSSFIIAERLFLDNVNISWIRFWVKLVVSLNNECTLFNCFFSLYYLGISPIYKLILISFKELDPVVGGTPAVACCRTSLLWYEKWSIEPIFQWIFIGLCCVAVNTITLQVTGNTLLPSGGRGSVRKCHISSLILNKIPKANQLSSPDSGQHFQVNNYFFLHLLPVRIYISIHSSFWEANSIIVR